MKKLIKFVVLSLLPVFMLSFSAQVSKAETMTWLMKSKYPYKVSVSFYSKSRRHSWPGGTKVWVISDSEVHEYTLRCNRGEKICFGAWVRGNSRRYWGVGKRGYKGCSSCCYRCNGGETRIQTLRR